MSFMPSPGSLVELIDGRVGIVADVSPNGSRDSVWIVEQMEGHFFYSRPLPINQNAITKVLWESPDGR